MQDAVGRRLLAEHGLEPDDPMSFLLLDASGARTDSDAIIAVLARLGGAWRAARLLRLVPRWLRDPLYRRLARNRYRWFGRREACYLPPAARSEEHTSELQSLMRNSYAVFCLKKKRKTLIITTRHKSQISTTQQQ